MIALVFVFLQAAPAFVRVHAAEPVTSYANVPGLALLAAAPTRAFFRPLVTALEAARVPGPLPKALGCNRDAVLSVDFDVAGWLTEMAQHPDGHERAIRVLSALGVSDAQRFVACVVPTKKGVDLRGRLVLARWSGMLASVGAPELTKLRFAKDAYWSASASLAWPDAFRAVKQIDKAWANTRGSRLDAAIAASSTLLDVDFERAFVAPLTGRFDVALVYRAATKEAAMVAVADAKSTADAARVLAVTEETMPRASFDRTRQKNEWGFVAGVEPLFVRLGATEMRAANAAFALALAPDNLAATDGAASVLGFVDVGRYRRLYERVGRIEDTTALVRELHLAGAVDMQKTPHPKALFVGVEKCEAALKRGESELSFTLRCVR
ncbi:MAG: hypothetical protein IT381_23375 [Deltaproteobacteria bacterium]|nr:hypothetical protein [Deltaproteobacteria bacterium]